MTTLATFPSRAPPNRSYRNSPAVFGRLRPPIRCQWRKGPVAHAPGSDQDGRDRARPLRLGLWLGGSLTRTTSATGGRRYISIPRRHFATSAISAASAVIFFANVNTSPSAFFGRSRRFLRALNTLNKAIGVKIARGSPLDA